MCKVYTLSLIVLLALTGDRVQAAQKANATTRNVQIVVSSDWDDAATWLGTTPELQIASLKTTTVARFLSNKAGKSLEAAQVLDDDVKKKLLSDFAAAVDIEVQKKKP